VITGQASDDMLDELYQARRSGQNAVLILTGGNTSGESIRHRAKTFAIPVFTIASERDLNIWMQQTKETRRA
jgi:hypothetical protein